MIAPQTKFISETSESQANSAPRSSIIGIKSTTFLPFHDRIEPSHSDYSFMPPNPPLISGGSVSVGPLRGPLLKSFRLS